MNRRLILILTALAALTAFAVGAWLFQRQSAGQASALAVAHASALVRIHAPVMGPPNARVTVVEFFDPSCEACRAFYPYVKKIIADFSPDVRLVIRYAPFHQGSDEAVAILEMARAQNRFEPVLDALVARQPEWAAHGAPNLALAWSIAGDAGLQYDRASVDAITPRVLGVLKQDMEDVNALAISKTPSFFVNGKPLTTISPDGLRALVQTEVQATRTPP